MEERKLTEELIWQFETKLREEEKSQVTMEKYLRDVRAYSRYVEDRIVSKEEVISYKKTLIERGYAPASINSMLASLHKFFACFQWTECRVKPIRIQRQAYCSVDKELTKEEYFRLLNAARRKPRLFLVLQTIGSTGIRVSELQYFTVEEVQEGIITVSCKNKTRTIFVPAKLRKELLRYCKCCGITENLIFRTRTGRPMDRSNIWSELKKLCGAACVSAAKVFPHNLRKLFARVFYEAKKDIAKLADILGHSSIDTTRIYLISTGREHLWTIEQLGLLL